MVRGGPVIGRHKCKFKPGQLAWVCYSEWSARASCTVPCTAGRWDSRVSIPRGEGVTVLRPARIGDYHPYMRTNIIAGDTTWARSRAETEWLVLSSQGLALMSDGELRIRRPVKGKNHV